MPQIDYAALSFAIVPGSGEIQLTPAGVFRAKDGRPKNLPGWKIDAAIAARVIERAAALKNQFVIDYEHQTLEAAKNGQPAPAAGWYQGANMEWRDGQGLFATKVEWTDKAKAFVDSKEYKYISPVLGFNANTGEVVSIRMAALTNDPGIDGMNAAVVALAHEFFNSSQEPTHEKDQPMKALALLLGLKEDATEAEINAAVVALKAKTATLETENTALKTETAALKTQTPDPAKFVPVETVTALTAQVASLTTRLNDGELEDTIQAALSNGKLLPAMESWARDLGKSDLAALKAYVEKNPAIQLNGNQTGGKEPGKTDGELDVNDADAISRAALKFQADQAKAGNAVTTVEAVNHVTKGV